MKTQFYSTS